LFNLFKHLLPHAEAWTITIDKVLRQLFEGTAPSFEDAREWFDLIWLDLFPQTTRHLTQWESQFGLTNGLNILLEQDRRNRLEANWQATGGQSPYYIQTTLRAAGFDVYVYDWWSSVGPPPVERDPALANYLLVNKLYTAVVDYEVGCGEPDMECGEAIAECGENNGIIFDRTEYPWPGFYDPWRKKYVYYICGPTFGSEAVVPIDRLDEFEDLVLKLSPEHLWIGMYVRYAPYIVEDGTGDYVVEDGTGKYLLE
jgi:hypothetical protein